jgi:hypothetical protein
LDTTPKDIPAFDAPDADFVFADETLREAAIAWANSIIDDLPHHSDRTAVRACRVLINNTPQERLSAELLLAMQELVAMRYIAADAMLAERAKEGGAA